MAQTLVNQTTGRVLATNARRAETLVARFWGLIGRTISPDMALCLPDCNWVHTFGLRAPLDVAYCGADGIILQVLRLPPSRIGPQVKTASHVWEMAGGSLTPFAQPGDTLVFVPFAKEPI